jgi:ABC-type multidrug transport system fused ATPase/permease subunit
MARRERQRAERRKRKQRSAARQRDAGEQAMSGNGMPGATVSRSELKDRQARRALEPLREEERPTVVTVGAVISAVLAALSLLGYALWDVADIDEERPALAGVIVFVAIIGVMAWGMWRARYWAVLGFQTVLVLTLVLTAVGLLSATTVLEVVGNVLLLAVAGTLFYLMIKAMARIQMPQRLPRE